MNKIGPINYRNKGMRGGEKKTRIGNDTKKSGETREGERGDRP